jgi:hypothetical protein
MVQMFYLSYIHLTRPHEEQIFNALEFTNEYAMLCLSYLMINFTTIVALRDAKTNELIPSSPNLNKTVEYLAIFLITLITVINFSMMVTISTRKIKLSCKKKKMMKQHTARMERLESRRLERESKKAEYLKENYKADDDSAS